MIDSQFKVYKSNNGYEISTIGWLLNKKTKLGLGLRYEHYFEHVSCMEGKACPSFCWGICQQKITKIGIFPITSKFHGISHRINLKPVVVNTRMPMKITGIECFSKYSQAHSIIVMAAKLK